MRNLFKKVSGIIDWLLVIYNSKRQLHKAVKMGG